MTLPELIEYFKEDGNTYQSFCRWQNLDSDAEAIELFMQKPFGLNNKVEFFRVEETAGRTQYSYNGSEFYNLFDFYYFLNAVKESERPENSYLTDIDLALKLIDYAEKDG